MGLTGFMYDFGRARVEPVLIPCGEYVLRADLGVPAEARAIVVFAHSMGPNRQSLRSRAVAATLQDAGIATLLVDLLTDEEDQIDQITDDYRFDVARLTERLIIASEWLASHEKTVSLPVGYFGSNTGVAAALRAAAHLPDRVKAVVSKSGRPDLAGVSLGLVHAATLFIVGELDTDAVALTEDARKRMRGETRLVIVPNATHLFEELGALEEVSRLAMDWFSRYLVD
jgi:pimeloyl-ACP methyl ester carboxylesterase